MATPIVDLTQTYDQSDVNDYSIAMGVHMISPVNSWLQLILPKVQVGAVQREWIQDELLGLITSLATAVNSTLTTITITSGDVAEKFADVANQNHIINIDSEYMLATATPATDQLTISRGYQGSTAASHTNEARVWIVSQPTHEGADAGNAVSVTRTRPSNYVQTFRATIEVSGVQEAVRHLGGVTSEMGYEMSKAMMSLANQLEMTIIRGPGAAAGTKDTNFRVMDSLNTMIDTNRAGSTGSITTTHVETDIQTIWDAGGTPVVILGSGAVINAISNLYKDRIRSDPMFQIGGQNITGIINPLAEGMIFLVPHRYLYQEYFMLDLNRIALGFIRPFFMKDLADAGDADKRMILGDYTLELHNETAHCYRSGIT